MSPYLFTDYKKYLDEVIEKASIRGIKALLADAAGCQRSFLSQVLNGSVHLTLDHALGIAQHLRLSPKETDYFYNMVGHSRAATPALKSFYKSRMRKSKQESNNLSKRLNTTVNQESVAEYYSSWKFAAIHILSTIPEFQTIDAISKKLSLTHFEVESILNRLSQMKLVKKKGNKWTPTKNEVHLPKDHFMTQTNHKNWRERNLVESSKKPDLGLTYSSVYSMSRNDFEKLKEMTIDFLKESRSLVIESKEEELVSFCIDCVIYK